MTQLTASPVAGTETVLGKSVSALQSDIAISNSNVISGTLNYVTGYTGFSGNSDYQEGNYLVLKFEGDSSASITMELINGVANVGEVTLDSDGIVVVRITNKATQSLKMRQYVGGVVKETKTYTFTGLTLAEASS